MALSSKTLAEMKATLKRDTVLLGALQRHVLRANNESSSARRSDVLHPSQIVKGDWCTRQSFYELTGVEGTAPAISTGLAMVFAEGHNIHERYQEWFRQMGVLYGRWKCIDCAEKWYSHDGSHCDACGSPRVIYCEFPVEHEGLRIGGSTDGIKFPVTSLDEAYVIEIKTIGLGTLRYEAPHLFDAYQEGRMTIDEVWRAINRPFGVHLRQAFLYIWLLQNGVFPKGVSDSDIAWLRKINKAVFIYEFKPNQQVKELVVTFMPEALGSILEQAEQVVLSVKHGIIPDRPRWAEADHKTCKACPYSDTCWSTNDGTTAKSQAHAVRRVTGRVRRKALGRSPYS